MWKEGLVDGVAVERAECALRQGSNGYMCQQRAAPEAALGYGTVRGWRLRSR